MSRFRCPFQMWERFEVSLDGFLYFIRLFLVIQLFNCFGSYRSLAFKYFALSVNLIKVNPEKHFRHKMHWSLSSCCLSLRTIQKKLFNNRQTVWNHLMHIQYLCPRHWVTLVKYIFTFLYSFYFNLQALSRVDQICTIM